MKKTAVLILLISLALVGCLFSKNEPAASDSELVNAQQKEIERLQNELANQQKTGEVPAAEEVKDESVKTKAPFSDSGDFKIFYGATQNSQYAGMNEVIKNSGVFENAARVLNWLLILKKDFPIVFQECGAVNAFYNPQEDGIIICNELLENFGQNFVYFVKSQSELDQAITDATYFILYHELGHGLIDIYDLVYSGREEDVVDQLSTVILVAAGGEAGARAAVAGANFFYLTGTQNDVSDFPFWDEHALDQQRYYNILCWVYGSNPEKYSNLVGPYALPQERAAQCQREYQKMSDFWDIAVYPYLQEEIKKIMKEEGIAPK